MYIVFELSVLAAISAGFVEALGTLVAGRLGRRALVNIGTLPAITDKALLALTRVATCSIYTVAAQGCTVMFTSFALIDVSALETVADEALFTLAGDTADRVCAVGVW